MWQERLTEALKKLINWNDSMKKKKLLEETSTYSWVQVIEKNKSCQKIQNTV